MKCFRAGMKLLGSRGARLSLLAGMVLLPVLLRGITSELRFDIFTQEDGLPNNLVQCVYQDSKGWIWIGTSQGLSRFDGYTFVNFLPDPEDSTSLQGNLVRVIKEDKKGNLLVGTETGGLNIFDRNKESFTHPFKEDLQFRYKEVSVNDLVYDREGTLWIGTDYTIFTLDTTGILVPLDPEMKDSGAVFNGNYVRNLQFDNRGMLWIGTNDGLFTYDPDRNEMNRVPLEFKENQNKEIWEIYLDDEGLLWIGTYSSGVFLIDPETGILESVKLTPEVRRSETVRSICKGAFGEFWIGTRGGLYVYSKFNGVTGFFRHDEREPLSLSNNSVLSILHDRKGDTWIGTRGGLNLLAKSKQVFRNFSALPDDNRFLNSSIVYAFRIDDEGKIWIGTEDGGINIYDPEKETYTYLMADPEKDHSLSQNCIKAFLDDRKGNVWVGTFLGGIDVINLKTGRIRHYRHDPASKNSLADNRVWDMTFDNQGNLWVATSRGADKFDPQTHSFIHYNHLSGGDQVFWIEEDDKGNLWMGSSDEVIIFNQEENTVRRFYDHTRSMYQDSKNQIWIATLDKGIAIYSPVSGPLKYYNENDGLANNQSLCILEDDTGHLWISTSNGLSRFHPETEFFQNYSSKDGLNNNQFCYGAACRTHSGELLFGTISGFIMFDPGEVVFGETPAPLVLTDLKIFNKSVPIGTGKNAVLKKSISETDYIELRYRQNVFTVEFAALNYVNSENNLYSYMLEGFDRGWNEPSTARMATYTNLNPDDYVLRIKQIIPGNSSGGNELKLNIKILPPFRKTTGFIIVLFVFILLMIYTIIRFFINREKIKNQLVLERVNARKLHELDMMKLKFFTNVSHDIRTPLTLILGPLEKMLNKKLPENEIQENLKLMQRNAKNLNNLIDQLLDFRKLQAGNLQLNLTKGDMVLFIRNVVQSYLDYAAEKQITLRFNTLKKRLFVSFDPDKIEKILNNLITNAFKFTEPGDSITINLTLVFDSDEEDFSHGDAEKQLIEITVKDTGKGIPPKNLNRIFLRFFQVDDQQKGSGTGIGLALVKELVNIHKGTIYVTSKPGKGSKFTIRIPYQSADEEEQIETGLQVQEKTETQRETMDWEDQPETLHSKIMLVVEDNQDVRQFICNHFKPVYTLYEARDGEEGWEITLKIIPDVIISDIIMPKSDGYELCKRIKNDERTSHIPVLLLTAMHSREHEIRGLTTGADDYITKPFDLSVLQVKVENVLSIRESLKEKYTGTLILEPRKIEITSPDERFLQRAIQVVEANISNSELDIEGFAVKVGVSRMQLYRKLHALTDMTVKEFIRHIRLKRATQLLIQGKMNISEVAYEVGFKDLSHFRKCFKREYGMSATEYMAREQKEPTS